MAYLTTIGDRAVEVKLDLDMNMIKLDLKQRFCSLVNHDWYLLNKDPGLGAVIAYQAGFSCWRQLVVADYSFVVYRMGFLLLLLILFRKPTWIDTWRGIFGQSKFNFKRECIGTFLWFLAITVLVRLAVRGIFQAFGNSDYGQRSFLEDCLVAPLSEDPVFFGFMMTSLCRYYAPKILMPVLLVTLLFVSFHPLANYLDLLVGFLGVINAVCYLRFQSLGCCLLLHIVWNMVGCL